MRASSSKLGIHRLAIVHRYRPRGREPIAVLAMLPEALGSWNRRALLLGWAYYLDAFSSYPLRTWLPNLYCGHDNWYTRGAFFPIFSYYGKVLSML
ncbi:hypothetical protein E6C27_scaffold1457G00040 [Cucumis melo var. makuwa]|uniref:Uncharacterized protein n=1 Tax=Cucumis melo var. makuwa TaxID=1194695 RepID=A0A5A7TRU7_CUCMM|nr:hypothetical protein E6C27_scaffold1457G00040 [Cucumis melo var. makuwa]